MDEDLQSGSGSAQVSEAERRRQERRRKILQNQESRLQKIIGPNASKKDVEVLKELKSDEQPLPLDEEELSGDYPGVSGSSRGRIFESVNLPAGSVGDGDGVKTSPAADIPSTRPTPTPTVRQRQGTPARQIPSPAAFGLGNPDGIEIQGQLPVSVHRLALCTLGFVLPFLDLNCFLLYFFAWEITVWKVFDGLKEKPAPPNLLVTLILVMGLTEQQVVKFQKLIRTTVALWSDFCLFFMSTALTQILFYSFFGVSQQSSGSGSDDETRIEIEAG